MVKCPAVLCDQVWLKLRCLKGQKKKQLFIKSGLFAQSNLHKNIQQINEALYNT